MLDKRVSQIPHTGNRSPFRQDRDRILYSTEFRRLAGVTQVAAATEKLLIHNRITHSFKVEQVGTSIVADSHANGVAGMDRDAEWRVAAAGLGHDIGHPPFGHVGEEILNSLLVCEEHVRTPLTSDQRRADLQCTCLLPDGFEGNAQSFRILNKLAVRGNPRPGSPAAAASPPTGEYRQGLDLTRGTLRALTKYPWLRGDNPEKPRKWGAYDCDAQQLAWVLQVPVNTVPGAPRVQPGAQALEAQIMDWADDITYAVHDIDDFFRLGLVPLDALRQPGIERRDFLRYAETAVADIAAGVGVTGDLQQYVEQYFAWLPERPFRDLPQDIAAINSLVSQLINELVSGTVIGDRVEPAAAHEYLVGVLKQLTWYYVIDNPALANIQEGQKRVLTELWSHLSGLAFSHYLGEGSPAAKLKRQRRLPVLLRYHVDSTTQDPGARAAYPKPEQRIARGVVDFIASLTDLGAYELHARLVGDADVSILDPSLAY